MFFEFLSFFSLSFPLPPHIEVTHVNTVCFAQQTRLLQNSTALARV